MPMSESDSPPQGARSHRCLWSMGRHSSWLWIAALAVVVGAALSAFTTMSADTDLWGHLRFGEAHWESGQLELTDSYSFTSGEVWINHEWLSELIFFASYNAGGDLALPVVMALWVNLHGGFLIGCAVIAVVVVSESVVTGVRGLGSGDLRWLWAGATEAAVATLLNPYGLELLRFLLRSLSLPRPIGEWSPLPMA